MREERMLPKKVPVSQANEKAARLFEMALQEFSCENFANAVSLIGKYREAIRIDELYVNDNRKIASPKASVVIVAYDTCAMLIACIKSLYSGSFDDFEIIAVDNGKNDPVVGILHKLPILYVRSPCNLFLSEARNVGVSMARAPVCVFLDDDAIADTHFLKNSLAAFAVPDVLAIRGKVLPKTHDAFQGSGNHYNLGAKAMPHVINTEGNSAWRKDAYQEFSGMDPLLFGHEGTDLSHRMNARYGKFVSFYWPGMVIYHDYANTADKKKTKEIRHERMLRYLEWKKAGCGAGYIGQGCAIDADVFRAG